MGYKDNVVYLVVAFMDMHILGTIRISLSLLSRRDQRILVIAVVVQVLNEL